METDLFNVDPVTNEIVYDGSEVIDNESGVLSIQDGDSGSVLDTEAEALETQEEVLSGGEPDGTPVVLSEEITEALLASSPASGSLNSSTINYFDRLVDGLPADFGYVAFRNSSDDAYAGSIIYGEDWEYSDGTVVFGDDVVEIDVSRVTGSGYTNYITYDASDASNSVIRLNQSGTILYYTNVVEGYPILGTGARPLDIGPFVAIGLITAMAVSILTRLLSRRG